MSNIIKIMSEDSNSWWLFGIVLILIVSYITLKYLEFKTYKINNREPENISKQYKINKITIKLFLNLFIIYFLSYPIYYSYLANNIKNNITWSKLDDKITFTSHNPLLKSKTFKIEIEKDDYFVLNDDDKNFIKIKKDQLKEIEKILKNQY